LPSSDPFELLRAVAADVERHRPDLRGKTIAEVPALATPRLLFRRRFYRDANIHFGLAALTLAFALFPFNGLWMMNAAAAGLSVWTMIFSERHARMLTRQLHRPAIEQVARDLVGWPE
jgi:hypothetical protein